jgi:hypothetical protein
MTWDWARHRQKGISALGAVLIMAGIGTLSVAAQTSAADDDPLALFAELMPVFSSPRCVNCHGGTDPSVKPDGLNHGGGQVDVVRDPAGDATFDASGACLECHNVAPPSWRLAPKHMSLVGKDTLPLCRQMRSVNSLASASQREVFSHHLNNDPLIDLAFVGESAIGPDSPMDRVKPAPPPMGRGEFMAAAQRWLDDGQAMCSNKWSGTITETTSASERVTFAPAAGSRTVSTETHLTINVVENRATASVKWEMKDFTNVPYKDCPDARVHHTFVANGNNLPVELTIVLNRPNVPSGGFTIPELPPGITLPPGFALPPGMTLPPGVELPNLAPGGAFVQYQLGNKSEIIGNHRSETKTNPCSLIVKDERHPYQIAGAHIDTPVDPNDPNRLVGEKTSNVPNGKTVIKWDLKRGEGQD